MSSDPLVIARTGSELWRRLVEIAGLEPDTTYDRAVRDEVGRALGLGWGSDFAEEIERAGSSPTEVLVAVLGALQPWAEMMRDLLRMMEACGANRTRSPLHADVDIGQASRELELDLSSFTEAVEAYEEATVSAAVRTWTLEEVRELADLVPNAYRSEERRVRVEVQRWLDQYEPKSRAAGGAAWPSSPPAPTCGDPDLDRALKVAWSGFEALIQMYREVSISRDDLDEKGLQARREGPARSPDQEPTVERLAIAESDFLAGFLIAGLDDLARRVREKDESRWGFPGPEHMPGDLIKVIEGLPTRVISREDVVRRLRDLLSLPVWKHRYDLYSNWVFTVIVAAAEEVDTVVVEHDRGAIDFGFNEARMASIGAGDLAVYCELRSPLVGPSAKRTEAIQPDYSILRGDHADPAENSVLEIECKQYQAPDRRNFTDALRDYASSRPKANVVLVDYGPVSDRVRDRILGAIDPPLCDRCLVIGDLRPPSSAPPGHEARAGLTAAVHEAIGADFAGLLPPDLPARIDLTWEAAPPAVDLDLHLEVLDGGRGRDHVSFRQPEIGDPVHTRLLADVLEGPGPETLLIERWLDATYRLWVHRFDDGELGACAPRVELSAGEANQAFDCPPGSGSYWCVFEVDGSTRRVSPLSRRDQTPGWS